MAAAKIKQFVTLRSTPIERMEDLKIIAESARDNKNFLTKFNARFSQINVIFSEFERNHNSLLALVANIEEYDIETENAVRKNFDDTYYDILAIHSELFKDDNANTNSSFPKHNVKLPKIELPKFDGDPKTWKTFIDMFTSLVHDNSNLSKIEKFNYLISSLSGPPLSLVKCNPLSDDNYYIAFDALMARYDNKRLLATTHYLELENMTKLSENNVTPQSLRRLIDVFEENLAALTNMGFPVEHWDFLLFNMLLKRLDSNTVSRFEIEHGSNEIPSFESLKKFVLTQCDALDRTYDITHSRKPQRIEVSKNRFGSQKSPLYTQSRPSSSFFTQTKASSNCPLCKQDHVIYRCSKFLTSTPEERYNVVKINKWCSNCLGSRHSFRDCSSQTQCLKCGQRHHTLLHFEKVPLPLSSASHHENTSNSSPVPQTSTALTNFVPTIDSSVVLLSTALVEVLDSCGTFQTLRVLLDSGSQANFITEKCCHRLGLPKTNISLSIQGLGHMNSKASKGVSFTLRPRNLVQPTFTVDAVIIPQICDNMPKINISNPSWSHISDLPLADPEFNIPNPIDILLGADIFPLILETGREIGKPDEPVALKTVFGWILMGTVSCHKMTVPLNSFFCTCDASLESSLKRFWEIEEIPRQMYVSPEDELCEKLYSQHVTRTSSGRFSVALPFKISQPVFPDSKSIAQRRFVSLERRLLKDHSLYQQYSEFMKDYLDSGHMTLVQPNLDPDLSYYIPHHSVVNMNSSTTKLRVVFDASCKASNGNSLNDTLLVGPKLQRDLFNILLNFRLHAIALTADIRQMYRQILVNESHRKYQKILWRFSPKEPVQEYILNTVTYGVSSAPYLAIKTLLQLADEDGVGYPQASEVLRSSTYVDDIVVSVDTVETAQLLKSQLISLLGSGGFKLHKWVTNAPSLLEIENTPPSLLNLDFDTRSTTKILGLQWNSERDTFSFQVNYLNSTCTKRAILSDIARVFDPLGFLAPLTLFAKRLIQYLWTLNLGWDDNPPEDVVTTWLQYKSELPNITQINISRHLLFTSTMSCELHGFSDASEKGYAAVVYIRAQSETINTILVCAKSKVSPLKVLSIPRLELCAAHLLSDLLYSVLQIFDGKINFRDVVAWTDSSVTLYWIQSQPHKHHVFVGNRISKIQEKFSANIWHYVPSADNPADCASRGMFPSQFINYSLWWAGPYWLKRPPSEWPAPLQISSDVKFLAEEKPVVLTTMISKHFIDSLINTHSTLPKIQRIMSYVQRFIHNLKNPASRKSIHLTHSDLDKALLTLIYHIQQNVFSEDISRLRNNNALPKPLRKLNPFLDPHGILRVGGRLSYSKYSYDKRFPILLPSQHRLTTLIIETFHKQYLHPGVQTLHFLLCNRFWILSAKKVIRKVISKCHNCWRLNPKSLQPSMGNLPLRRISQIKPFSCVGVDFCGPYSITMSKTRGAKTLKAYICVFVCFATKALHLELVSDLSSEAFLAALRRFISRRGRCSYIYSDCGTNFVGASKQISKMMESATHQESLSWHFNPPSSPHFGGLWEAGVKSVKTHISRVIGDQILTYEELNTLLIQIEAMLNSRPLYTVSTDPNDLSVLTPGHFLTLEPITSLPDDNLQHLKMNQLTRWQLLQRLHQDFWSRWSREYLHTLHQRSKWHNSSESVPPGTLVLIKADNLPPLRWQIGRILETHPGVDGVSRVATVHTNHGNFKRPLVKLCPLPMDSLDDQ